MTILDITPSELLAMYREADAIDTSNSGRAATSIKYNLGLDKCAVVWLQRDLLAFRYNGYDDWSCMLNLFHHSLREFSGSTPRKAFDRCLEAIRDNEPIGGKP